MTTDKKLKQLEKNQLVELNLAGKTLTLERAQRLADAIAKPECKLKHLDLSKCEIANFERDKLLFILAEALQKNKSIIHVNLFLSFMFNESVTARFIKTLQLNQTITEFNVNLKNFTPQALSMVNNAINDNVVIAEKEKIYTPQFFKMSPTSSRKSSKEQAVNVPVATTTNDNVLTIR